MITGTESPCRFLCGGLFLFCLASIFARAWIFAARLISLIHGTVAMISSTDDEPSALARKAKSSPDSIVQSVCDIPTFELIVLSSQVLLRSSVTSNDRGAHEHDVWALVPSRSDVARIKSVARIEFVIVCCV